MIKLDESALICDLAETYQIYDYKQLPPTKVAVFCYGLRNDSRIKMKLAGLKINITTMLLAQAVDALNTLLWTKTKDGQKNRNRPKSIFSLLTQEVKEDKKVQGFNSSEEFEKALKEFERR
ncbi:DUF5361 domain-containing protein [Eremococcus coleocola]|uniref:DUF5361 domain-containing protein n=1 Tax=Eremococcus coleocola TaxID=88132 RepID=UPI00058EC9CE|nr:DUF5361 domain-containing protein [Eremococcus coleocola]